VRVAAEPQRREGADPVTAGTQCDNCRKFGPSPAPGWFYLGQQPVEDEPPSIVAALFGNRSEPLTFCTVRCLSDWAFVHAAADEAAEAGKEPQS
jgi:hypothetical protein